MPNIRKCSMTNVTRGAPFVEVSVEVGTFEEQFERAIETSARAPHSSGVAERGEKHE